VLALFRCVAWPAAAPVPVALLTACLLPCLSPSLTTTIAAEGAGLTTGVQNVRCSYCLESEPGHAQWARQRTTTWHGRTVVQRAQYSGWWELSREAGRGREFVNCQDLKLRRTCGRSSEARVQPRPSLVGLPTHRCSFGDHDHRPKTLGLLASAKRTDAIPKLPHRSERAGTDILRVLGRIEGVSNCFFALWGMHDAPTIKKSS
jgi:hypothetical protein